MGLSHSLGKPFRDYCVCMAAGASSLAKPSMMRLTTIPSSTTECFGWSGWPIFWEFDRPLSARRLGLNQFVNVPQAVHLILRLRTYLPCSCPACMHCDCLSMIVHAKTLLSFSPVLVFSVH